MTFTRSMEINKQIRRLLHIIIKGRQILHLKQEFSQEKYQKSVKIRLKFGKTKIQREAIFFSVFKLYMFYYLLTFLNDVFFTF